MLRLRSKPGQARESGFGMSSTYFEQSRAVLGSFFVAPSRNAAVAPGQARTNGFGMILFLTGCAIGENLFGNDHRVNGSGKPGKDRDRKNDLNDFRLCAASTVAQLGSGLAFGPLRPRNEIEKLPSRFRPISTAIWRQTLLDPLGKRNSLRLLLFPKSAGGDASFCSCL